MPVAHMIIHRLVHENGGKVDVLLSTSESHPEALHDQMFQQLRGSFLGRVSRKHGNFAEDEENQALKSLVSEFLQENLTFEQLSKQLMQHFETAINERKLELDYHFIFFVERTPNQHIFYLFLTKLNEAITIDKQLNVIPCFTLDTGGSLCGVKLDIDEWQSNSQYAYMTVVPPRGNPSFSDLLDEISGFGNAVNREETTLNFLEGIESYTRHMPEEKVAEYRAQVVDYCLQQDERDEPVSILGLSKSLGDVEAEHFSQEMAPFQPQGREDILIDRRSMRRYVKFFGRDKDLSVSFSTFHLNKRVLYDEDNDVLTIDGLPRSLRNQLLKYTSER